MLHGILEIQKRGILHGNIQENASNGILEIQERGILHGNIQENLM